MRLRTSRRTTAATVLLFALLPACTGAKVPNAGKSPDSLVQDSETPGTTASAAPGTSTSAAPGASATSSLGTRTGGGPTAGPTAPVNSGGGQKPRDVPGDLNLFDGNLNTRGISNTDITLCAHAALTYGAAFNTSDADFKVFWQSLNDRGGVYGRKVTETFENDNYDGATAVQAATTCQGKNPFAILGGIGFDQIPLVREWADQHKELYLYHDATSNGAGGKRYSYSSLPTVEKLGEMFAELAHKQFPTKRIGVLYRNSEYWDPGYKAFRAAATRYGLHVVIATPVEKNQATYRQQLDAMAGKVDVVWAWENALAATEMINQWTAVPKPTWMVFPFNLTTQSLVDSNQDIWGIASWPAYSYHDYSGPFESYAADIKQFEADYAKYDSGADLKGLGGDLLFLNWVAQKALAELFFQCGKACTRNHFATILSRYKGVVRPNCLADFSSGTHLGGDRVNVFHTYTGPSGKFGWKPTNLCVNSL